MKYFTYILYSEKFDCYYYGQTEDLEARLIKHNSGLVVSTSRYLPWILYAFLEFSTRSEAFCMEKQLKNCKGRERLQNFIIKHDFKILGNNEVIGPEN
jgi:putative endonuclease